MFSVVRLRTRIAFIFLCRTMHSLDILVELVLHFFHVMNLQEEWLRMEFDTMVLLFRSTRDSSIRFKYSKMSEMHVF